MLVDTAAGKDFVADDDESECHASALPVRLIKLRELCPIPHAPFSAVRRR
jgi:hypothetical protein